MADRYSFTTKVDDNYLFRVRDETPNSTKFLLITDSSTVEDAVAIYLFINKEVFDSLVEQFPMERLLGHYLGDWAMAKELGDLLVTPDGRFYVAFRAGLDRAGAEQIALAAKNEIKRLQNVIDGRTVRVTVESF